MPKRHLKSIAAPKSWPIKRKQSKYVTRPNPGSHRMDESLPINFVLKLLGQVNTTKEAKHIINQRKVNVNKKPVRDIKFPVGLLDVVNFSDKHYRILYNKRGKLTLKEIKESEASLFLHKIRNKTKLKGNKTQLNFHSGLNLLVGKDEFKTNDVLVIENKKVKERVVFENGSLVYIIRGKNLGKVAKIEEIHTKPPLSNKVTILVDERKIMLPKSYVFVIGKSKPIIDIK